MRQKIAIIGAGITGLACAYVLNYFDPELQITIIDAAPSPKFISDKTFLKGHFGATLGHSRDARQFTGTEGLCFQNPVHTALLFKRSSEDSDGWCSIPEKELRPREKRWRKEVIDRYEKEFTVITNPYNKIYTALNYGGMEAWSFLVSLDKSLAKYRISHDNVYVAFESKDEAQIDFESESAFNPFNSDPKRRISFEKMDVLRKGSKKNATINHVYPKLLKVPGSAWHIQSLWKHMYGLMKKKRSITFKWGMPVEKVRDLPDASVYVWTSGSGHVTPDIYTDHGRVQGIGGVWLTIPNPGFTRAFKISAPQPNGYVNVTPEGELLHMSGGFGWVGERSFKESCRLLKSVETNLIARLSEYFDMPEKKLRGYVTGYCIRPTTPTGLPDVRKLSYKGREHIMLSGAGKAGSTQSSLLALYLAKELKLDIKKKLQAYNKKNVASGKVIGKALAILGRDLEP